MKKIWKSKTMKNLTLLLTLLVLSMAQMCFGEQVTEQVNESITEVVGDNLYLDCDYVDVTDEGIFVLVEGHVVRINNLSVDDHGVFTSLEKLKKTLKGKCKKCGEKTYLGVCTNSKCSKSLYSF